MVVSACADELIDKVGIAPLGNTVRLQLNAAANANYQLESVTGNLTHQWVSLMRFRGGDPNARNWVDPMCGSTEYRFFRLRRLLELPPAQVSNFRLLDPAGVAHELYYDTDAKGVVLLFAGTNYTSALPLIPELSAAAALGGSNLLTWIVVPSDVTQREELAAFATNLPPNISVLQDLTHAVTRTLSSGQTPEVVLVNTADFSISYRGPVSQSVDTGVGVWQTHLLADAVTDLLAFRPATVSQFATAGVSPGLRPVHSTNYSDGIAPLLLKNCMPCHSPGNIAS
ncbi:MAG TPA: hypothetical protein VHH73_20170, partial [Verrucomicrobiae bacterium]|nr:hypothetical protein [Verrucomicrobiae bacterium]